MNIENVIIMTDIDGTLVTDEKQILDCDREAIDRFRSGGGTFTLATGRGYSMAKPIADRISLDVPAVIFNGSAVYDFTQSKFLWHSSLEHSSKQILKDILAHFPDMGCEVLCAEEVYVPSMNEVERQHLAYENVTPVLCGVDEIPGDWLKILFAYPPAKIQTLIDFIQSKPEYLKDAHWVRSEMHYYEMLPDGVTKGSGFKRLLEILNRPDAFTVGVGDYNNDIELIRDADLGIAVASAQDAAKAVADHIVCDNNSGAIAEVINYIEKL